MAIDGKSVRGSCKSDARRLLLLKSCLVTIDAIGCQKGIAQQFLWVSVAERSPLAGVLGVGALAALVSNYHSVGVAFEPVYDIAGDGVGA